MESASDGEEAEVMAAGDDDEVEDAEREPP